MRTEDTRRIWRVDNPTGKIPATAEQRYEHQLKWRDCPWPEEQKPTPRLATDWGSWNWHPSGIVRSVRPAQPALRSATPLTPVFEPRTCVHEACHAIVDDEIGRRVLEVFVATDGSGVCRDDQGVRSNLPLRDSAVNAMAVHRCRPDRRTP